LLREGEIICIIYYTIHEILSYGERNERAVKIARLDRKEHVAVKSRQLNIGAAQKHSIRTYNMFASNSNTAPLPNLDADEKDHKPW